MPTRSSRVIRTALEQKGFRLLVKSGRTDHDYYAFYAEEKKTSVWTKISRGSSHDVRDRLFSIMARECKLSTGQFLSFVDCSMAEDQYKRILVDAGHVSL